jgi:hypothetical protein
MNLEDVEGTSSAPFQGTAPALTSLSPCSRVLIEKLTVTHLVNIGNAFSERSVRVIYIYTHTHRSFIIGTTKQIWNKFGIVRLC